MKKNRGGKMASLSDIEIKPELRPCLVKDKKALFHKWGHTKNLLGQEFDVAIVEYEDGQIEEVTPNNLKFCDNNEFERSNNNFK